MELRKLDDIAGITSHELSVVHDGYSSESLRRDIALSLQTVPYELRGRWPDVVKTYHAAHLALTQNGELFPKLDWDKISQKKITKHNVKRKKNT